MKHSRCPRCTTMVEYEEGETPKCPTCSYPGEDTRPKEEPREPTPPAPPEEMLEPKVGRAGKDEFTQLVGVDAMEPPEHSTHRDFVEVKTSGKAIAALVLGLATYLLALGGLVTAVLAIIFGTLARKDIRLHPATLKGQGMATAGMWLGIAFFILFGLLFLIFGAALLSFLSL